MLLVKNNVQSGGHYRKINTKSGFLSSLKCLYGENDKLNGHYPAYYMATYHEILISFKIIVICETMRPQRSTSRAM